ncbi:MAG: ATP-binding cassette domain-containing protein [Phycisphaerae bacterium]
MSDLLLDVTDLVVSYGAKHAVDGVSFQIARGETLALVGESGSGKSSTGRAIVQLAPIASGRVEFLGADVSALRGDSLRRYRRQVQMIFQDTVGSLNPKLSIFASVEEPLRLLTNKTRAERRREVMGILERVDLSSDQAARFPLQLSGGQRQRACIARALVIEPELVICDEPVSALDLSVQAKVLDLLGELGNERGLSYLFVTHDLAVMRRISDRVAVMKDGQIVESGDCASVLTSPKHPYTQSLLDAVLTVPGRGTIAASHPD